ncbi:cystathionine beta-lyase [Allomyces javanicus]|nr:cystathionine beta-lyase [Allomyces javanicus]
MPSSTSTAAHHRKKPASTRLATQAVAAPRDPCDPYRASSTPLYQSATFHALDVVRGFATAPGATEAFDYARSGNPTRRVLEKHIQQLTGAASVAAVNSGMAALDVVVRLTRPGDHVVTGLDLYGGTHRLLGLLAEHTGVVIHRVDTADTAAVARVLKACAEGTCTHAVQSASPSSSDPDADDAKAVADALTCARALPVNDDAHPRHRLRLVLLESPTNPRMHVVDIRAVAKCAHALHPRALVVVDNTMLSPVRCRPLLLDREDAGFPDQDADDHDDYEDDEDSDDESDNAEDILPTDEPAWDPHHPSCAADLEIHSGTKFLSGHHDATAGVICSRTASLGAQIARLVNAFGCALAPFECFLVARGLKTLALRMNQAEASALALARTLASCPGVTKVHYPGLTQGGAWHARQRARLAAHAPVGHGGAVLAFETGNVAVSERVCTALKRFATTVSFGCVDSLVSMPCRMSHASIPAHARAAAALPEDLIRVSVGIEDTRDLVRDVRRALRKAGLFEVAEVSEKVATVGEQPQEELEVDADEADCASVSSRDSSETLVPLGDEEEVEESKVEARRSTGGDELAKPPLIAQLPRVFPGAGRRELVPSVVEELRPSCCGA